MDINNINSYKDGGTIKLDTTDGVYYIDNRIKSTTKGVIYKGYPEKDNSNAIEEQDTIKSSILESLSRYDFGTSFDWRPRVYELLNKNK